MGASSKYLVIYHAISAGQNGPNLGCDEEEIVMILYLVLNVAENKVSFIQFHINPCTGQCLGSPLMSFPNAGDAFSQIG